MLSSIYSVRPCRQDEFSSLEKLLQCCPELGWNQRHLQDSWRSSVDKSWLLCEKKSGPIAFAILREVADYAEILAIGVDPEHRGRGVGKTLLSALIGICDKAGHRRVLLEVRETNRIAIRLYEMSGFLLDVRRVDYYPPAVGGQDREAALLYSLSLD